MAISVAGGTSFFNELNVMVYSNGRYSGWTSVLYHEEESLWQNMKKPDPYLDQQEIKNSLRTWIILVNNVDTYGNYSDTIENREEQVEKLPEDILNKKTKAIKDWLLQGIEESDIDSDILPYVLYFPVWKIQSNFLFLTNGQTGTARATIGFMSWRVHGFPVMGMP